jgi:hypothetical protein
MIVRNTDNHRQCFLVEHLLILLTKVSPAVLKIVAQL